MNLNKSLMKTDTHQRISTKGFFSLMGWIVAPVSPVVCVWLSVGMPLDRGRRAGALIQTAQTTAFPIHVQVHRWSAFQTTRQDLLHFGPGTMWDWKFEINEYTDALSQIVGFCNWCPYFWSIKSQWGFPPWFYVLFCLFGKECKVANWDTWKHFFQETWCMSWFLVW